MLDSRLWFHTFQLEILRLLVTRFTLHWIGLTPMVEISRFNWLKVTFAWKLSVKIQSESSRTMPCCPDKYKPLPPLYYSWSASWTSYPNDNLKCDHQCSKYEKKRNFNRVNKEAIAKIRKKFLGRKSRAETLQKLNMTKSKSIWIKTHFVP